MSPNLQRVKEIFDAAFEAGDRAEVIARLSGGDQALIAEVNSLLALHDAHDLTLDGAEGRHGRRAPGDLLAGRYRVTCFLASGGMGDVYAGVDEETGGKVALKFIGTLAAADPRTESRFRREVDLARRVEHPNVCRVFALTGHERERFCVMELLEGETLAARLERLGPFTVEQALPVALELCDGLAAAHAAGVIHRDLKPGNIFLTPGRAVIIDFGLASAAVPEESLTSPTAVIGTLAYMAPEQLEGTAITERTDIFALGVVLFEMLTGHKPHAAKSPFRLAAQKASESHRYQGSAAAVPLVWREVIARCLRAKPEKRFASPVGIKRALERGRPSVPFVLGQPWVLVPMLAVLAVLTAWLGWKGWRSDYRPAPQAVRLYGEGQAALMEAAPWRGIQLLGQAVAEDGRFVAAGALLAVAYAEVDQPDKARDAVLEASAATESRWHVGEAESLALKAARSAVVRNFPDAAGQYLALARASKDRERSFALQAAARMHEQAGKTGEALTLLETVKREDPRNYSARVRLGLLLSRQGRYERSAAEFRAVEAAYEKSGNREGLCDLLLARSSTSVQDLAHDRQDVNKALALSESTGNRYHNLSAKFQLATIATRERGYERSMVLTREAAEQAGREGMTGVAAQAMGAFGYGFNYLRKYEEGIPFLREAVAMAERSRSPATLALNRMRLGETLGAVRRYDEAVVVMEPAVAWYRKSERPETLPMMLIKLSTVYSGTARYAEAESVLEEALDKAGRIGNQLFQAMALGRLIGFHTNGNLRKSADFGERLLTLERKSRLTRTYYQRAESQARLGHFGRALELLAEGDQDVKTYPPGVDRAHLEDDSRMAQSYLAYYRGQCEKAVRLMPAEYEHHRAALVCAQDPARLREQMSWCERRIAIARGKNTSEAARLSGILAEFAFRLGDFRKAKLIAEEGYAASSNPYLRVHALQNLLVLRAAQHALGDHAAVASLTTRCLELARAVGFDPPESFGGRQDLLRLWAMRQGWR